MLTNNPLDGTIGQRDGATGTERNTLRATASMFVNAPAGDLHLAAVSASGLPPGFRAFVRVIAIDACGQTSAPTPDLLVQ